MPCDAPASSFSVTNAPVSAPKQRCLPVGAADSCVYPSLQHFQCCHVCPLQPAAPLLLHGSTCLLRRLPLQPLCGTQCQRLQKTVNRSEFSWWKPPADCCRGETSRLIMRRQWSFSKPSSGLKTSLPSLQAAGNYPAHLRRLI